MSTCLSLFDWVGIANLVAAVGAIAKRQITFLHDRSQLGPNAQAF
jgi:hypothetical protein